MDFDDDLPISTDHSNQEKENYDRSAASGSSSLAVASAKASTSGTQAKSNAAGEGTRSDRERALLIRRFKHRKNWGMKVPAAEKRPVRSLPFLPVFFFFFMEALFLVSFLMDLMLILSK